ncbi:HTH-type transcriptional activator Btr [Rubripirellula obstinata]|uniref:HTH-type transcriptional activator Btr n=1 Tax=Rubripirellula obstinata TaxID=406547 RepID=A0A5B1CNG6_9BACT|nr:AraC family transcriptional regulator [Rubripirellula obstinata]KAA1261120.1 HTH-type transcriptional activator Btr [Rubripirellula obstinata]
MPTDSQPELNQSDPAFISDQVSQARRYYLDLNPSTNDALTVVCGGVERTRADYVISRDCFPYFGMELVTEGRGEVWLGDRNFSLTPGVMFAYGPQTPHRIVSRPEFHMRKYFVDFTGHEAEAALRQTGLLSGSTLLATRMHELVALFEMLDREARIDGEIAGEVCRHVLQLLFAKIRQCCLAESPTMPRAYETYERVREHIEKHFLRLKNVDEVAAECDITPVHLSRLFRRFGGIGAYRFLLRKKMNRAAEMLLEERLLVKQVAEELDFSDAFQFSRAFKRIYGIPPNQLVESRQAALEAIKRSSS